MSWLFGLGILMSLSSLVLESRCRGFLSSEKIPWNQDVVAYLSPFLDVVVFCSWNLDVVAFCSWNLDVVAFWSWNLDAAVFWSWTLESWYMCLHGLVFAIIVKTKKSRIIMSIMLLKNNSVVQIYTRSICIIYDKRIIIINRIL